MAQCPLIKSPDCSRRQFEAVSDEGRRDRVILEQTFVFVKEGISLPVLPGGGVNSSGNAGMDRLL